MNRFSTLMLVSVLVTGCEMTPPWASSEPTAAAHGTARIEGFCREDDNVAKVQNLLNTGCEYRGILNHNGMNCADVLFVCK